MDGRMESVKDLGTTRALFVDEQEVGAAGLFDVGAGLGVAVHVVGISVGMRLDACLERHGVVETCLDVAGAVRCSAIEVGRGDLDGLDAARVVRADGGNEDAELVLVSGLDADDVAGRDHEGTDVERCARAERRNPGGVCLDDFLDRLDELLLGERRHHEAGGRIVHALGVEVGAEADDIPVFGGVCLEALEDLLAVMEDARALGEREGMVGRETAFFPCAVTVVADVAVVSRLVGEPEAAPIDVFLFHGQSSPVL